MSVIYGSIGDLLLEHNSPFYRALFVALYDRYFNFNNGYGIKCNFLDQYCEWLKWYNPSFSWHRKNQLENKQIIQLKCAVSGCIEILEVDELINNSWREGTMIRAISFMLWFCKFHDSGKRLLEDNVQVPQFIMRFLYVGQDVSKS